MTEASAFWNSLKGKVGELCKQMMAKTLQCERYDVTTAPNGTVIGVRQPFSQTEIFIPYTGEVKDAKAGDTVLVVWWGSLSTAKAWSFGGGPTLAGGGGGGTSDYTALTNKPAINGIELIGNKTGEALGLDNEVYIGPELPAGLLPKLWVDTDEDAPGSANQTLQLLWKGSWTGGSLTIAKTGGSPGCTGAGDLGDYPFLLLCWYGLPMLCSNPDNDWLNYGMINSGSVSSSVGTQHRLFSGRCKRVGNTISCETGKYPVYYTENGFSSFAANQPITAIYGWK